MQDTKVHGLRTAQMGYSGQHDTCAAVAQRRGHQACLKYKKIFYLTPEKVQLSYLAPKLKSSLSIPVSSFFFPYLTLPLVL
jgi:hypothetical protein